jgi:ribonuclease-3
MIEGLAEALKQFGIVPKDISLFEMAFTHASYTNEHPDSPSYDRLEFLGDSILDMVIGDFVYQANPTADSGHLSKMRAVLVEGKTLTDFSEVRFGFDKLVRYSVGEKGNVRFHHHINEDVFESFVAAVYLDQGYAFVREMLAQIYAPLLPQAFEMEEKADSKSRLQELLISDIDYVVTQAQNVNTEDVSYTVEARMGNVVLGTGRGHNQKEAEINAAADALSKRVGN